MLVGTTTYPRHLFKLASQAFPAGVVRKTRRRQIVKVESEIGATVPWKDVMDAERTTTFTA